MATKKKTPKKRTRRAVKARRTPEQRVDVAQRRFEMWLDRLELASNKVAYYRRELRDARRLVGQMRADLEIPLHDLKAP